MADGKFSNFTTRPAKDFSLEITDKSGTDITIGAESGGYYPLSTSLTGKLTAGTWGRFHDGTATDNNVIVGRIKKGECTVAGGGLILGTASGGGLSGGGLSVTDNKTSITPTVSVTLSAQTTSGVDITNDEPSSGYYLTINGSSSSDSAVVNRAKVDRAEFSQTVTRADITDAHTAGYIPAKSAKPVINSDSTTVTLSAGSIADASQTITVNAGSKTRYITIPAAVYANGFVNSAGYIPEGTNVYTTAKTDECITINFN